MGLADRDYYRPSGFGGFSFFPPVIKNLLIINGIVFFIQMLFDNLMFGGIPGRYTLNYYFALNPLSGITPAGEPYNFQIWQLITYQFMHGGFGHIFFNMFMLWMFGMEIENLWGSKKFLIFYMLAGITGGLFQLLITPLLGGGVGFTIGASGAVFGVMVAFAMFFPDRYIFLYFLVPVKAKYLIAFLVILEFLMVGNQSVVAHLAHIGGVVSALIFILVDRKKNINFDKLFSTFKDGISGSKSDQTFQSKGRFRKPFGSSETVQDAEFHEINSNSDSESVDQAEIDRILDKISRSGYQNLTEREKKILFEASKKN